MPGASLASFALGLLGLQSIRSDVEPASWMSNISYCNANQTRPATNDSTIPRHFGTALFHGFEPLDVHGTAEVVDNLANRWHIEFNLIAETLDPVSNKPDDYEHLDTYNSSVWQALVPTYTFANPPPNLEVLIVPGGIGTFYPQNATVNFIRTMYPKLRYLITVCSGAMLAAETGLLDGKRATTNKQTWSVATLSGPKVDWVPVARWVVDDNIWTSSGVSAGMDALLGFVECLYGTEEATFIANSIEYERHSDPSWDPFSAIWNVTGS